MSQIELVFYMEPVPKALPKSTFGDGSVQQFNPAPTATAMAQIKANAISWVNEHKYNFPIFKARVPVYGSATFIKSRPQSLPKRILLPAVKPDLDNYCKLLLDALKGVIFEDDGQITGMMLEKEFVSPGALPRIEVTFGEMYPGLPQ